MRTLYLRIVVTFIVAFLLSSVAILGISAHLIRLTTGEFFEGSAKLELQQAQRIYETGGPSSLAEYLAETNAALKGRRYVTNAKGRDLVSGVDRSQMRSTSFNFLGLPKKQNGQIVIVRALADGRYHLILVAPPPLGLGRFIPYFLCVALAIAIIAWALSAGIVSPLHRVADAVDRFAKGDLSARVEVVRKDEIGNLARSFNSMAERIATLLTAERRLLQDVSHELRSPLARLSFAAELVKDAQDPNAAAARVRREVDRLTSLVSTLIQMTSAEGDSSSRKMQRLAMAEIVQEVVHDCALEAKAHNLQIEADLQSSSTVEGDPELLRRAVENVLRNAIRYSPAEHSVSVRLRDQEGSAEIAIRDYGPGVPEDMLARIFDPFFRVSESRDGADGGVGLGLSIARRAVLIHHGQIDAANASPGLQVNLRIPTVPA